MSRYCPIVGQKVTYQFCEDCDEKICKDKTHEPKTNNDDCSDVVLNRPDKERYALNQWL